MIFLKALILNKKELMLFIFRIQQSCILTYYVLNLADKGNTEP